MTWVAARYGAATLAWVCLVAAVGACSSDGASTSFELPDTVPAPSVSFPVEGDPPGQHELNDLLVRAPLGAATERLKAAGWVVHSVDLDDPDAGVTDDLRNDRVTVGYRDGIVVRVEIG